MESAALRRRIHRFAWLLACAWPLSLHAAILSGGYEWAPRLTALAAALGLALWVMAGRRMRTTVIAAAIALCIGVVMAAAPEVLLYAPSVLINVALAVLFGMSLRASRVPVISAFARLEHSVLPPDLARYTRTLTWTWTVFFAAMAAISLTLASIGSQSAWSTLANVTNYVLVAALFCGEYLYRRWRFREYRHASLIELARNVRRAGVFSIPRSAP